MICKPEKMDFSKKNIIMIISGTPGVGKTTLALSAPDVLLIDADNGMCRVNPKHRKDASICKTFEEVLNDISDAKGHYKTIVVDTGGALVEMMKQHIISHPDEYSGGTKKSGGISQQGFGMVKQLFLDFSAKLRTDFNVIYLFHEQKDKEEEKTVYSIVCEGSAKTLVYQPADLACHMFIENGKRKLGFTPTEQYYAKSAYGIKGIITVPELGEDDKNSFLETLFNTVRKNLKQETEGLAEEQERYEKIMADVPGIIACVKSPEDCIPFLETVKSMEHALTSKAEIMDMFNKRIKELGIRYDSKKKAYVVKS